MHFMLTQLHITSHCAFYYTKTIFLRDPCQGQLACLNNHPIISELNTHKNKLQVCFPSRHFLSHAENHSHCTNTSHYRKAYPIIECVYLFRKICSHATIYLSLNTLTTVPKHTCVIRALPLYVQGNIFKQRCSTTKLARI